MFIVTLAYLAFVSLALPPSMLGVVWPSMRLSFSQPLSAVGLVPPVGVLAGLVSTSLAPYILRRFGVGRVLAVGTFGSVAALALSAASTNMWQFLAAVAVSGLAAGAVDTTLNVFAARTFGPRRINLMHAFYGLGAAVSPLIATAVIAGGVSWRWAYLIVMGLQLVVALVFTVTRSRWDVPVPERTTSGTPSTQGVWSLDSTLGIVLAAVQNGIEATVAIWSFVFLTELGVSTVIAGGLTSGYWLTLVIGRIGFGSLAERVGSWRVMGIAVALLLGAAVLANLALPVPAMAAVLLFGVGAAPVYPLLVLTTAERTSPEVADRVIGFQAASSSIGNAIAPGLVGLVIAVQPHAFGWATAALAVTAAVLVLVIHRRVYADARS
ncbi:MAG: MFS transporter [Propionibacteriaceae bacterium]|nr:MFS transporter [Propionibacteriaceae bacterium]